MKDLKEKQSAALNMVCSRLNEGHIPAKMEDDALTALFSNLMDGDVFTDVAFLPQHEEMEGLSFCILQFTLPGFEEMNEEQSLNLCIGCSMIGSDLLLGGYCVETDGGDLPVSKVLLRATLPLLLSLSEEAMAEEIYAALSMMASDLTESGPKLLALAKDQISIPDFLESC